MDYSLGALKLMGAQLKEAIPHLPPSTPSSSFTLGTGGLLFQRAWLQGILVSTADDHSLPRFLLDDGTAIVELASINTHFSQLNCQPGMYVMVVGSYVHRPHQLPLIKIHKLVDLSAFPDREAMWYLEVIEAYRMFYGPCSEERLAMEECNDAHL